MAVRIAARLFTVVSLALTLGLGFESGEHVSASRFFVGGISSTGGCQTKTLHLQEHHLDGSVDPHIVLTAVLTTCVRGRAQDSVTQDTSSMLKLTRPFESGGPVSLIGPNQIFGPRTACPLHRGGGGVLGYAENGTKSVTCGVNHGAQAQAYIASFNPNAYTSGFFRFWNVLIQTQTSGYADVPQSCQNGSMGGYECNMRASVSGSSLIYYYPEIDWYYNLSYTISYLDDTTGYTRCT